LLDFNNGRLPFASAQIGRSFRNEISPRAGLLRVREFTMAEIEHFVDPEDGSHVRFDEVRNAPLLSLLSCSAQEAGKSEPTRMSAGEAVKKGVIANETLAYFLARVHLFLARIGVDVDGGRMRFRQHMGNEMAHYASDCWDAEVLNSSGWTECVGCADRAAYDLSVHSKRTGHPLVVRQALKEPVTTEQEVPELNKKVVGPKYGKLAPVLMKKLEEMGQDELLKLKETLAAG
jgi:glycyl-tRNA synthetase